MTLTAGERTRILSREARLVGLRCFVETGTADGATTLALKDDFERLITIELDHERYLHVATATFLPYPQILPLWGDSAKVLEEVANWLPGPAMFWLDAHYCGGVRGDVDTPIEIEVEIAARQGKPGSRMIIDDARLFGTDPAYPTISRIAQIVDPYRYTVTVKDDMIFVR